MRVNKQQSRVKADKDSMNVLLRLMKYTIAHYKAVSVFVLIFIIISSLATVVSSLFIKSLIDDYITPLLPILPSPHYFKHYVPWEVFIYVVLFLHICIANY